MGSNLFIGSKFPATYGRAKLELPDHNYQGFDFKSDTAADVTITDSTSSSALWPRPGFGPVAADRFAMVFVGAFDSTVGRADLNAVELNGVTAAKIADAGFGTVRTCSLWAALVPTGETCSVAMHFAGSPISRVAIEVFSANKLLSQSPFDAVGVVANNLALNAPVDGFAIATMIASSTADVTWVGLTKDHSGHLNFSQRISAASDPFLAGATAHAFSVSGNSGERLVAASWR